MNASTPKNNVVSSASNISSTSHIRLSYLKPPPQVETKGPVFLQQTKVSLYVAKNDNDLPDYSNSPILISEDQHTVRSLAQISGGTLEASCQSSLTKASGLIRKETMSVGLRESQKPSMTSLQKGRNSNSEPVDVFSASIKKETFLERNKVYARIMLFLDYKWTRIFLVLITIYALFGQDIGTLATTSPIDTLFDVLTLICCSAFMIEMVLTLIVKKDYRWTFFFWLDLISTLSMLLDLSLIPSDAVSAQADATQIARAGRVSKIGARAGRVIRFIRLVRIVKLYKEVKPVENLKRMNSQSVQSLTNLVDNIVKLKKQISLSQTRKASGELLKKSSLKDLNSPKETSLAPKDPNDFFGEEKTPISPYAPRRPSKFADKSKSNDIRNGIAGKRRIEQSKTFVASLSDVYKKNETQKDPTAKEEINQTKELRIGKLLSDLTTKRVIIIVLLLLLVVPMMSADAWNDDEASYTYDVDLIKKAWRDNSLTQSEFDSIVTDFLAKHTSSITPIIYFRLPNGTILYSSNDPFYQEIKADEVDVLYSEDFPDLLVVADLTLTTRVGAGTNIGRTVFICLILTFGALLFSKDANYLVLQPLERMVEKVNRIAVSPLSVKRENLMDESQKKNETTFLENAIIKIGTLLALGFGDAGAQIIAQNITQTGDMNPMLSGEKIMAIFGFCDIRNFTDATEVLQEDVMVFVNSIAEIVHNKVDKYGGSANKNIGDAFLLVWKYPKSEVEEMDDEIQLKNTDLVKGLADLSLFSFLKIYAKINQSPVLKKYRSNPKLLERLPNYRVKMGFGLHVGWAIEGAIGSEYKIDASYLSPNVNIASRLEAATKQYGVPLLISNDLYVLFSDEVQKFCRKLDVVTVKGSQVPLTLYTVDMDQKELKDKDPSKRRKDDRIRRHEAKKQKLLEMIWEGKLSTHLIFERDKDLKIMMKKVYDKETVGIWEEGIEAYISGDWKKSRLMFDRFLTLREDDGPATTLLNFMKSLNYQVPEDWRGFRELMEK